MRRRALVTLSLLSAAVLAPLAACSTDGSPANPPAGSSKDSSDTDVGTSSADSARPSVDQLPELYETEIVAARQKKTHGNRSIQFGEGKKGDALIIAVRCRGAGTINVTVRPTDVGFPLECIADEVTTTYNQVGVSGAEKEGTVVVEAPSAVQWSMTIGRGEAAEAESPGVGAVQ